MCFEMLKSSIDNQYLQEEQPNNIYINIYGESKFNARVNELTSPYAIM